MIIAFPSLKNLWIIGNIVCQRVNTGSWTFRKPCVMISSILSISFISLLFILFQNSLNACFYFVYPSSCHVPSFMSLSMTIWWYLSYNSRPPADIIVRIRFILEYRSWVQLFTPRPWAPMLAMIALSRHLLRACKRQWMNLAQNWSTFLSTRIGYIVCTAPPPPESPVMQIHLAVTNRENPTIDFSIPAEVSCAVFPDASMSKQKLPIHRWPLHNTHTLSSLSLPSKDIRQIVGILHSPMLFGKASLSQAVCC